MTYIDASSLSEEPGDWLRSGRRYRLGQYGIRDDGGTYSTYAVIGGRGYRTGAGLDSFAKSVRHIQGLVEPEDVTERHYSDAHGIGSAETMTGTEPTGSFAKDKWAAYNSYEDPLFDNVLAMNYGDEATRREARRKNIDWLIEDGDCEAAANALLYVNHGGPLPDFMYDTEYGRHVMSSISERLFQPVDNPAYGRAPGTFAVETWPMRAILSMMLSANHAAATGENVEVSYYDTLPKSHGDTLHNMFALLNIEDVDERTKRDRGDWYKVVLYDDEHRAREMMVNDEAVTKILQQAFPMARKLPYYVGINDGSNFSRKDRAELRDYHGGDVYYASGNPPGEVTRNMLVSGLQHKTGSSTPNKAIRGSDMSDNSFATQGGRLDGEWIYGMHDIRDETRTMDMYDRDENGNVDPSRLHGNIREYLASRDKLNELTEKAKVFSLDPAVREVERAKIWEAFEKGQERQRILEKKLWQGLLSDKELEELNKLELDLHDLWVNLRDYDIIAEDTQKDIGKTKKRIDKLSKTTSVAEYLGRSRTVYENDGKPYKANGVATRATEPSRDVSGNIMTSIDSDEFADGVRTGPQVDTLFSEALLLLATDRLREETATGVVKTPGLRDVLTDDKLENGVPSMGRLTGRDWSDLGRLLGDDLTKNPDYIQDAVMAHSGYGSKGTRRELDRALKVKEWSNTLTPEDKARLYLEDTGQTVNDEQMRALTEFIELDRSRDDLMNKNAFHGTVKETYEASRKTLEEQGFDAKKVKKYLSANFSTHGKAQAKINMDIPSRSTMQMEDETFWRDVLNTFGRSPMDEGVDDVTAAQRQLKRKTKQFLARLGRIGDPDDEGDPKHDMELSARYVMTENQDVPVLDEDGNPVMEEYDAPVLDEKGHPTKDENGNDVTEKRTRPKTERKKHIVTDSKGRPKYETIRLHQENNLTNREKGEAHIRETLQSDGVRMPDSEYVDPEEEAGGKKTHINGGRTKERMAGLVAYDDEDERLKPPEEDDGMNDDTDETEDMHGVDDMETKEEPEGFTKKAKSANDSRRSMSFREVMGEAASRNEREQGLPTWTDMAGADMRGCDVWKDLWRTVYMESGDGTPTKVRMKVIRDERRCARIMRGLRPPRAQAHSRLLKLRACIQPLRT